MPKIVQPVRRRTFIQAGLALGASQVIGAPFIITARGDEAVKIGMVNPLTGVLAALAQSEVDGAKYAEADINNKGGFLGRPVQPGWRSTVKDEKIRRECQPRFRAGRGP